MNLVSSVLKVFVLASGIAFGLTAPARAADTYKVDPVHSSIVFKIKHAGASNFYGRFNDVSGTVKLDEADASKTTVEVKVKTASVDTKEKKRDEHLKGPDFFNAKEFPTIEFKSKQVKKTGDKTYDVTGDLTLHGVTKPLTVKLELTGTGSNMGAAVAGFETIFTISRGEFGINFMPDALGDDVQLTVSLEGKK